MPASRSRTEHWRDCLARVAERHGAIEISVKRPDSGDGESMEGCDLVWRVKVIRLTDSEIVVEPPAAFGHSFDLDPGIELIGAMTIGQNRWMFHTCVLTDRTEGSRSSDRVLVLKMPDTVERCSRRHFYRISTAHLSLPTVQCWPLMDPASVVAAETANRLQIIDLLEIGRTTMGNSSDPVIEPEAESILLPQVGPMFCGRMINVSGGGLGMRMSRDESAALERKPYFWLRVDLTPAIPAPVAVTARLVHRHTDSSQDVYAGFAFDFTHSPQHRKFVIELILGYVNLVQQQQRIVDEEGAA